MSSSNFNYSHGKLLVILLASSSFFLALYLFKYSETKYSIVSWLDVTRKGDIPPPTPLNPNDPDEPDQPAFNQRKEARRHMDDLAESAGNRVGGLAGGDVESNDDESFKPTDRWQEVPESHRMQPGVQYRVNQLSGKVEARKETKTDEHQVKASGIKKTFEPTPTPSEPAQIEAPPTLVKPKEQTKPLLMTTPITPQPDQSKPDLMTTPIVPQPADQPPAGEQLESAVEATMRDTLRRYVKARTKGTKLGILQMLQHDLRVDEEAEAFMKLKGHLLFKEELETTKCKFTKAMIALIFGTVSGTFPHFKHEMYADGILKSLLQTLKQEDEYIVLLPTIFAVTQLVRLFPAGQQQLVDESGVQSLAKVFDKDDEDYQKLQIKVLNLFVFLKEDRKKLEDMLTGMRQHNMDSKAPIFSSLAERLQTYESIHLEQQVADDQYCVKVPTKFTEKQMVLKLRIVHWLNLFKVECSSEITKLVPILKQFRQDAEQAMNEETEKENKEQLKEVLEELKSLLD